MAQTQTNAAREPRFERPSEAVVYRNLVDLCAGTGGLFQVPLRQLARHCSLSVSTTNRAVLALARRGLIRYRRGANQSRLSTFEVPAGRDNRSPGREKSPPPATPGGANVSRPGTAAPKIGTPPAIVTKSDLPTNHLCPCDMGEVFNRSEYSDPGQSPAERFAQHIATALGDLKNLPLYKSYCHRFPVGVILNAFFRAKETPASGVKKSRGALFNFLVQLYGRERNQHQGPGHPAR